jgi:hypothetical protein
MDNLDVPASIALYAKAYNNMRILLGMGGLTFGNEPSFPRLLVNKNHHSCTIMGHYNMLKLSEYNIEQKDGTTDKYPLLELSENETLSGIELQRKLFENCGITDVTDEDLQKVINSHRNCSPELCPNAGE